MSTGALLAGFLFGLIGLAAFVYGKKQSSWRVMGIGAALTAALFIFRE